MLLRRKSIGFRRKKLSYYKVKAMLSLCESIAFTFVLFFLCGIVCKMWRNQLLISPAILVCISALMTAGSEWWAVRYISLVVAASMVES